MSTDIVPLADVCEIVMGQSPPSSSYNSTGDGLPFFQGKADFGALYPTVRLFCKSPARIARPGDVLISVRAPVGPTNLTRRDSCIGRGLAALRPKAQCDPMFLLYYLRYREPELSGQGRGSTFTAIKREDLELLPVPVPELEAQRSSVVRLERVRQLEERAQYSLEMSAGLHFASFLGLFGAPVDTWPMTKLGDLGTLDRGRSQHRPRNAPHLYGGPYPFIQTGDVSNADRYVRNHSQTYSEAGLAQSRLWPAGTLCITIAANIGKTAILTYPACFPDSVVGFTPGPDVTIELVQTWLEAAQQRLEDTAPEVAEKNINLEILRDLPCPVPPIALQQRFSDLVQAYEHLRTRQREAARQARHCFDSLLARTFREALVSAPA